MPGSGTLDKDWVDANFSYLVSRLGDVSPFEPSDLLYDHLGTLKNTSDHTTGCKAALKEIFDHVGLHEVPVHFDARMKDPGEFRYSWSKDQFCPVAIRISDRYKKIDDTRIRGRAVGAVISHEITHYYLMNKGIQRDTTDNERLTDLGIFVLGLGKLILDCLHLVLAGHGFSLFIEIVAGGYKSALQSGMPPYGMHLISVRPKDIIVYALEANVCS